MKWYSRKAELNPKQKAEMWDKLATINFGLAAKATDPAMREYFLEEAEHIQLEATKLRNPNIGLERMMK